MIRPRSVVALGGGCALIVAVNAVVLVGAAWNRGGEAPTLVTFTERELALPDSLEGDGSGLFLTLRSCADAPAALRRAARRRQYPLPPVDTAWLDAAMLRELGFRLDAAPEVPADDHDHAITAMRRAFVVFELEGVAWTKLLSSWEARVAAIRKEVESGLAEPQTLADAETVLSLDRVMRSRLVPIDAGLDEAALRLRHAGEPRTLIAEAVVAAVREGAGTGDASWRGRITFLTLADICVPAGLRPTVATLLSPQSAAPRERVEETVAWPAAAPPRYRATVAFGRRNEPWLVSVERIP